MRGRPVAPVGDGRGDGEPGGSSRTGRARPPASSSDGLWPGGIELPRGTVALLSLPSPAAAGCTPGPVQAVVVRGARPGPRLFLTAGVHGDELGGVEIVRRVGARIDPSRLAGDVLCVPIVNVPGFLNRSRYLPDGSDLNRSFPGSPGGGPAERLAHRLLTDVVSRCDFGIDFHTAARGRANVPHVRADMDRTATRTLARAFGTPIVVHRAGHPRSLRRVATESGVPTITLEAGATGRLEMAIGEGGVRGVENVLVELGMLEGARRLPAFQVIVRKSVWLRAPRGGLCELAVGPGHLVYEGQRIGTSADPAGLEAVPLVSPLTGLVIGASLDSACEPGNPLCHIVRLKKTLPTVERHLQRRFPGPGR